MDIKQIYREEKNLEPYTESPNYEDHFSNDYVKWLEAKINYTHCCTELKDDINFERKSSARVFNNEKGIWEFI
tara:strand:- start:726 stop:944 length:219 start_codon:yes stop_codon:yes gene_type:complete